MVCRLVWNVYIFDPRLLWDNRTFPQHINYVAKINSNSCLRLMYYSCGCTKSFLKIVSLKTTTKGNLEIKTKNRCSSNWEWAYLIWPFCSENANFALLTLLPVFLNIKLFKKIQCKLLKNLAPKNTDIFYTFFGFMLKINQILFNIDF